MICTVKKKFCSAGNRTELANYKLVMVNRIVVKHVVLFKHSWVMYKVIVHGVFSHYNIGVRNNVFEVNGLRISGTRINFFSGIVMKNPPAMIFCSLLFQILQCIVSRNTTSFISIFPVSDKIKKLKKVCKMQTFFYKFKSTRATRIIPSPTHCRFLGRSPNAATPIRLMARIVPAL